MINTMQYDVSKLTAQQSYTDLASLQNIKVDGKENQDLALRQVAQQFESMFIQMMLKSMRSANEVFGKDNPLNSSEMKHHQDMYDSQISLSLSTANKIGLADAFYRQMKTSYLSEDANTDKTMPKQNAQDGVDQLSRSSSPVDNTIYQSMLSKMPNIQDVSLNGSLNVTSPNLSAVSQKSIQDDLMIKGVNSPEDFIQMLTPYAKKAAAVIGVDYQVLIAQSALETGWGKHVIKDSYGKQSFNLFNIKADSRWEGKSVNVPTIEYVNGIAEKETASFRRYDSIAESFIDYQKFLTQPRYEKALASTNSSDFINGLQNAGYATDPLYADKIQRIIDTVLPKTNVQN
ncbi:MAG: flagellar protein FlgJ [Bermanella sp.]|jgi:flagellar protein FlgJ